MEYLLDEPGRQKFLQLLTNLMEYAGELGALLGEAPHVVAQGLIGLLLTPFEAPGFPRAHVSALEVVQEDLD